MKLLKVLVAVLVMAAMAVPVIAEDRLSLSGSMQVRGFYYDYDDAGMEDSGAWNDQRLRIGGTIAVAEGVSVNFRFDASESDENSSNDVAWGGSTSTGYAPYSHRRGDIQFDKAFLKVVKNGFTLSAGQMYFGGFGNTRALLDTVGTGFSLNYGALTLHHVKQFDENNGNDSFNPSNTEDERTLTAAKYAVKGDGFSVTPMVSYNMDAGSDVDRLGLGVAVNADLGAVAFKGELDIFDGENAAGNDDKGLQLYLDGSMAATDTVRVGGMFFYAEGQDGTDTQVTKQNMPVFADWHPESYGPWSTDFVAEFDVFDPSGVGAGSIAVQLYADVKASDDLKLQFAAMYAENEDDDLFDYEVYTLNAGFAYKLAENTTFTTHLNYLDEEATAGGISADADILQAISGLVVNF